MRLKTLASVLIFTIICAACARKNDCTAITFVSLAEKYAEAGEYKQSLQIAQGLDNSLPKITKLKMKNLFN